MSAPSCAVLTAKDSDWSFCPNIGASYAFAVFFGLTFIAHIVQGIIYRKAYTWVIAMSAFWQLGAYIFRVISILNPTSLGDYSAWFVLILVAPLWTNAFVYMVVGRMVWNFSRQAKVYGISAWRFTLIFVLADIVTFLVQLSGASLAAGSRHSVSQADSDLHIYMAGLGVQQLCIFIFCVYAYGFQRTVNREQPRGSAKRHDALLLLYTLYFILLLITVRIIFRIIEYSSGLYSTIPDHEAYQYCFDSLPMLTALVLLNIVHPGRIMPGPESDMPSRKARKNGVRSKADAVDTELKDTDRLHPSPEYREYGA